MLVHLECYTLMPDPLKISKLKCVVIMCLAVRCVRKVCCSRMTPYLIYFEKISVMSMKFTLIYKISLCVEYHGNTPFSINILSSDTIIVHYDK